MFTALFQLVKAVLALIAIGAALINLMPQLVLADLLLPIVGALCLIGMSR